MPANWLSRVLSGLKHHIPSGPAVGGILTRRHPMSVRPTRQFQLLSSGKYGVEFWPDPASGAEVWHWLSMLEYHVDRVSYEYQRLVSLLVDSLWQSQPHWMGTRLLPFTHNWDMIKKYIGNLSSAVVDKVLVTMPNLPSGFMNRYTVVYSRIETLQAEIPRPVKYAADDDYDDVRAKWMVKAVKWAPITTDRDGNIVGHREDKELIFVRREHVERLKSLWMALLGCFVIGAFKDEVPSTAHSIKTEMEECTEEVKEELAQLIRAKKYEDANRLLGQFLAANVFLSREGMHVRSEAMIGIRHHGIVQPSAQ